MSPVLLVIDLPMLLDQSKVGADAAKMLEHSWGDAKGLTDEKKRALLGQLEVRRDALRTQLLARARPHVVELAKKKGALAVVERAAVVWTEAEDITAQVIAKVDAEGPLKV